LCHDGSYHFEPALQPLLTFPWKEYRDLETSPGCSSERTIQFSIGARAFSLTFDRDMITLLEFLEKLPTVTVSADADAGELGPGSGGMITIWESEKFDLDKIRESIKNCLDRLIEDLAFLKQHSG
jgi:hypothetical protein